MLRLVRTGRLSDEHHASVAHGSGHRMPGHVRTSAAGVEKLEMALEGVADCYHCGR
jgi:hypothetical protein